MINFLKPDTENDHEKQLLAFYKAEERDILKGKDIVDIEKKTKMQYKKMLNI